MAGVKKKKSFATKAREWLTSKKKPLKDYTMSKKKEDSTFGGTMGVTVSKINKRRKALEDSLNY